MAGYQQQDAHEFFIAFLDGMDKHLRCYHGTGSDGTGSDNSQFNQDTVGVGSKSVLGISTSCSPPLLGTTTTACSYSPVAVRKSPRSPRSDGKLRGDGGCPTGSGDCMGEMFSPAALRRAVSETGPPSAGSMRNTTTTSCAEVLEVGENSPYLHVVSYIIYFYCMNLVPIGISRLPGLMSDLPELRTCQREGGGLPGPQPQSPSRGTHPSHASTCQSEQSRWGCTGRQCRRRHSSSYSE